MPELYFTNTSTQKRYRIIRFDKEAGTVVLQGATGGEFTEKYSRERFEGMGYQLTKGD